ncbi:MAG: molybdopterin-dependent oxidoreductase, partial [Chloroflexi bacterium]|nr:molybdopterin-dependent oxidoreductase [Chloroflexota bacterium]
NVRALAELDYVVVQDPFLTPTARLADLVLPVTQDLEREDLVTSWGYDRHLFHAQPALPPAGQARGDYWIFAQLAQRLGFGEAFTEGRDERAWLEHLLARLPLDTAPLAEEGLLRDDPPPRVALAEFRADPSAHPLPTPSGKIELVSADGASVGLPTLPAAVDAEPSASEGYPLQCVTPHSRLRSNSCCHANDWLRALEPHAVWIHPADASARDIREGQRVDVVSAQGRIRLPARVTERIMPGVVCVYQGAWCRPDEQGVDVGGCANTLTAAAHSPTGGMTTHSLWVEVRSTPE